MLLLEPFLQLLTTTQQPHIAQRVVERVLQPIALSVQKQEDEEEEQKEKQEDPYCLLKNNKENARTLAKRVFGLAAAKYVLSLRCYE